MVTSPHTVSPHTVFSNYPRVTQATQEYSSLPFENVKNPAVADNALYLAVLFAYDFRDMALKALHHELAVQFQNPSDDKSYFGTLLDLVKDECATDNIAPEKKEVKSHFDFICAAADAANVDISGIRTFYATNGQDVTGLKPDVQDLILHQQKVYKDPDACLVTIAMRESLPGTSSNAIIAHLPDNPKYDLYRRFLSIHVAVDGGDDGHGEMITKTIGQKVPADKLDHAMAAAAHFQEERTKIYRRALTM